jgi:hypothetical protein
LYRFICNSFAHGKKEEFKLIDNKVELVLNTRVDNHYSIFCLEVNNNMGSTGKVREGGGSTGHLRVFQWSQEFCLKEIIASS